MIRLELFCNPITNSVHSPALLAPCFLLCCYLECPAPTKVKPTTPLCPGGSHFFSCCVNFAFVVLPPFPFVLDSFYSTGSYPSSPYTLNITLTLSPNASQRHSYIPLKSMACSALDNTVSSALLIHRVLTQCVLTRCKLCCK